MYSPRYSQKSWRVPVGRDPTKVDKIVMDKMAKRMDEQERRMDEKDGEIETLKGIMDEKDGEIETLKGRMDTQDREMKRLERKNKALEEARKYDRNRIKNIEDSIEPRRRSRRLQDAELAQQTKMLNDRTFDKRLIKRLDFKPDVLKKFVREGTYHNATEWRQYVQFSKRKGILSTSSALYKNPEQSPRDLRLYILRLYNTRK